MIELIKLGHPEAERKLSGKVTAIQIRDLFIAGKTSSCFHLIRTEGPVEDVSYRKCIANLFPEMKELVANQSVHQGQQSGSGRGKKNENGRGRGGRRGGRRGKGRV